MAGEELVDDCAVVIPAYRPLVVYLVGLAERPGSFGERESEGKVEGGGRLAVSCTCNELIIAGNCLRGAPKLNSLLG